MTTTLLAPPALPVRTRQRHAEARLWLLLTLACIAVFVGWPEIDLAVSAAARHVAGDPEQGAQAWAGGEWLLVQASYWSVPTLGRLSLLATVVLLCLPRRLLRRPQAVALRRWRGRAPWIVAMLVLGVGLLVNAGFKDHWGRPRPVGVQALGGELPFRTIAEPSALCQRNCAFPSGHAAQGYALMVVGVLGAPHRRRAWRRAGLVAGLLIGAGRVLQGGHFLSDILFAGLMIWGLTLLLRQAAVMHRARRSVTSTSPKRPTLF